MTPKPLIQWAICSPENPCGTGTRRYVVVEGELGGERIITSAVVKMLRQDHRVFQTRSGSVYELVGSPIDAWVEVAGESANDFAPFDVRRFGVVFLPFPVLGRIRRQGGCDWLWNVELRDGLWYGYCREDRRCMIRFAETERGYKKPAAARAAAVRELERLHRAAGGKRIVAAGGGKIHYRNEPD